MLSKMPKEGHLANADMNPFEAYSPPQDFNFDLHKKRKEWAKQLPQFTLSTIEKKGLGER